MEIIKLLGIVIIVLGFYFRLDVLAVIVLSALVTGLLAEMSIIQILEILGDSFVKTRLMSIFLLTFPVIAILERHGLKERSAKLIMNIKQGTAGKVLGIYTILRTIAAALSLRIGGHVQFIRPLIYPMALAAAEKEKNETLKENEDEELKALAAAVENYANFFGQNVFVGASGVLLIQQTLEASGYTTTITDIAVWSIPVAVITVIYALVQTYLYDKNLKGRVK
ncbi:DUF969 domain-containing protein [Oceanivirga salmonicida]|uniref:DUF969 domain-containing protein n=1 Tax=Oceanivirga salmonicida TaxID=1769291 RepID=UPI00082B0475|nr:DUF969 domain-containing protein [Oceanivirga salmonicida]